MKIRKLTEENHNKSTALLQQTFSSNSYEVQLVEKFHKNETIVHEWVCIHRNSVIAYIAFSNAYNGSDVCGLHLAPLAVKPEYQRQGVGSELLHFSLRQEVIKSSPIFVLGDVAFYQKFGFESCVYPICPFDKNNAHFLCLRNSISNQFTVGYDPAFYVGKKRS